MLYLIPGIQLFFKRKDILTWKGSGKVMQNGQQILTNHRSAYV